VNIFEINQVWVNPQTREVFKITEIFRDETWSEVTIENLKECSKKLTMKRLIREYRWIGSLEGVK